MKVNISLALSLLLLALAGCAGQGQKSALVGGSPALAQPQASRVIVKLNSDGRLPAGSQIGGLSATLSYTDGKGLSIAPSNVVVSGAGVGATLVPNTTKADRVVFALIKVNGLETGEFATLSFDVARGSFPSAADFSVAAGAHAIDTLNRPLAGIGVSIASVTLQ